MDQLDREIEETRRRRDDAKRLFDQLEIEVKVLERAAKLRPAGRAMASAAPSGAPADEASPVRRGGKPAGTISMAWRRVLAQTIGVPEYVPLAEFQKMAEVEGIGATLASVRDRLRAFEALGYVVGDTQSGYRVTPAAVEKFSLVANEKPAPSADSAGS